MRNITGHVGVDVYIILSQKDVKAFYCTAKGRYKQAKYKQTNEKKLSLCPFKNECTFIHFSYKFSTLIMFLY